MINNTYTFFQLKPSLRFSFLLLPKTIRLFLKVILICNNVSHALPQRWVKLSFKINNK